MSPRAPRLAVPRALLRNMVPNQAAASRTRTLVRPPATALALPSRKRVLSPAVAARGKEEVATRRVRILRAGGGARSLLLKIQQCPDVSHMRLEDAVNVKKDWDSEDTESSGEAEENKEKQRRTRELQRSRKYLTEHLLAVADGGSLLEQQAVTPRVFRDYQRRVGLFLDFAENNDLSVYADAEIDEAVVQYMNWCFLRGQQKCDGEKLVAALMAVCPRFGRGGDRHLPRTLRALKGWRRLAPGRTRTAHPWMVWAAVAARMIEHGQMAMGLYVIIAFWAYLRPSEAMTLTASSFVAPARAINDHWTLFLFPEEKGKSSKTHEYDDSIPWDSVGVQWMSQVFKVLAEIDTDPLWEF